MVLITRFIPETDYNLVLVKKMEEPEFIPCNDDNGYTWVRIIYDGHEGFACDFGDCLEDIYFIYGHSIPDNYIKYDDPKLELYKTLYIKNYVVF